MRRPHASVNDGQFYTLYWSLANASIYCNLQPIPPALATHHFSFYLLCARQDIISKTNTAINKTSILCTSLGIVNEPAWHWQKRLCMLSACGYSQSHSTPSIVMTCIDSDLCTSIVSIVTDTSNFDRGYLPVTTVVMSNDHHTLGTILPIS